jgi:hypothetical protein
MGAKLPAMTSYPPIERAINPALRVAEPRPVYPAWPAGATSEDSSAVFRVNARFDEAMNNKLNQLAEATGLSTSDVLREAVARMHASVTGAGQAGRSRLDALVGKYGSAPADLSSNYKAELAASLAQKHGA